MDNIRGGELSEDASVSCVSPDSTEHFSAFQLQCSPVALNVLAS